MKKRVYLVTGAAGHLGRTIVSKLISAGEQVRTFVLHEEKFSIKSAFVQTFSGDVKNIQTLRPLFENLEDWEVICIHCAGIVTIASKYDPKVQEVNVGGTKNVMDLCMEYHVARVIHVSSVHAIPELKKGEEISEVSSFDPDHVHGLYAKTKAEASQYVLEMAKKGLPVSIIHPSGIIGPGNYGHGHLSQLIIDYVNHRLRAAVKGGYDFVDVRDVTDCILSCVDHGRIGECYICSNRYFEVKELLWMLHEITGQKPIHFILPMWLAKLTAPLSELYYKALKQPPLYTFYSLYTLTTNSLFSHEKATKELNYNPRDMKETLTDTVTWLAEQGKIVVKK